MTYLYVRIADQVIVERSNQPPTAGFLAAIATNYGGVASDYTYYAPTVEELARIDNGDEFDLVWDGSTIISLDFTIEDSKKWLRITLSSTTNKVTLNDLDITAITIFASGQQYVQNDLVFIDNKIYKCQAASTTQTPPGISGAWSFLAPAIQVTLAVYDSGNINIDTTYNENISIPISFPGNYEANLDSTFVNGICNKIIVLNSLSTCGDWIIPNDNYSQRIGTGASQLRVYNQETFKSVLPY